MRRSLLSAMMAAVLVSATAVYAVEPDERLSDPVLEARARAISEGLRCLICQNQSIDDSNAPLARDLRILVRERLKAGSSDADVERFLVDRYGEFVLLRPQFALHTLVLWLAPLALLGSISFMLWRRTRATNAADPARPLTAEEQARLDTILQTPSETL